MQKLIAATQIQIDNIPKVDLTTATIGNILTAVFIVIGGLAVLFLLVGAVRYITSNGDQSMLTQAKNTILYAIIGIVVALSGFAIIQLVIGTLSA